MLIRSLKKTLSLYLVFALLLLTVPAQGWAMFLPTGTNTDGRQTDLHVVQKTLESAVLKQRLADLGLSTEETAARIDSLSDAQLHQVASHLDSLQAGGDGADLLIFLLLLAILTVVILQATGHHVIIK